jgi:ASC-1-like (ASCH) protein
MNKKLKINKYKTKTKTKLKYYKKTIKNFQKTKMHQVIHESELDDIYFQYITEGVKEYEVRVNDDKRQKIKKDDIWKFRNKSNPNLPLLETLVTERKEYKSFSDAINATGFKKLLPQVQSIEEAIETYENFNDGKYKTDAEIYGVVMFKLQIIHTIDIQNPKKCPTFDYIKSGQKKVEGRKYAPRYHNLKVNNIIRFVCYDEILMKTIKAIRLYKTLEDYLNTEGFKKVLPCVNTFENALKLYNTWSTEKDRNNLIEKYGYGFMAIELK